MRQTRRTFAAMAALGMTGLFMAACGQSVSQLAVYAQTVANAGAALVAQIPGAPADLATAVAALQQAATAVIAGGPAPSASLAQQVYDAAKLVIPIAVPFLVKIPAAALAVGAIQALLPIFAAAAGLVTAPAALAAIPGVPRLTAKRAVALYGS